MPKQKKTPDGLPKIEQLPSGTYRCRVYLGEDENGKKIQKSMTNRDRNELIMEVLRLQKQHAEEKDLQRRGMCTLTVAEAMDEQLRNKSHVWSPSTIKASKSVRENRLQSIMPIRICDLTPQDIQRAIDADAAQLSPKTVANAYGLLRGVLTVYNRPLVETLTDTVTLPKPKKTEIRIPTDAEVAAIYDTVRETPMEIPFVLGAFMGLRRSEISGLRWCDIDWQHNTLSIRRVIVMDETGMPVVKDQAKTYDSIRTLQMTHIVRTTLEQAAASGAADITPDTPITLLPDHISQRWEHIQNAAHIITHYRFHDLRHYFCSTAILCNIPQAYVAKMLGHASERMVQEVYTHLQEQKKTENIAIMDAYISSITRKS